MKTLDSDYTPTLMACTKKRNDNIKIRVQDNGMGILKSLQDKIFQPFFTTKPGEQGTGFRLSMSYDIIKASEGAGATFLIQLPAPV